MAREEAYDARGIGSARVIEAAKRPVRDRQELTEAERASYADTALCRTGAWQPSHWQRDAAGQLRLVMTQTAKGAST